MIDIVNLLIIAFIFHPKKLYNYALSGYVVCLSVN